MIQLSSIQALPQFKLLTSEIDKDQTISTPFCCDLLSIAMGKAPADSCWITVMANVNTLAVASLTDVACIVLAENVTLDDTTLAKANEQNIIVFSTELSIFDAALSIYNTGL